MKLSSCYVSDWQGAQGRVSSLGLWGVPDGRRFMGEFYLAEGASQNGLRCLGEAAERGDVEAQFVLGAIHYYGIGVSKDYDLAFCLYLQAAKQGHTDAEFMLGWMYDEGLGRSQKSFPLLNKRRDHEQKAFFWYTKAADKGHGEAGYRLAEMIYYGRGAEQDDDLVIYWLRQAAEGGYSEAKKALTGMREEGKINNHEDAKLLYI